MKLLILLTITLTVNFSLLVKNSPTTDSNKWTSLVNNIDSSGTAFYNKSIEYIVAIKDEFLTSITDYTQLVKVAINDYNFNIKQVLNMVNDEKTPNVGDSEDTPINSNTSCFM